MASDWMERSLQHLWSVAQEDQSSADNLVSLQKWSITVQIVSRFLSKESIWKKSKLILDFVCVSIIWPGIRSRKAYVDFIPLCLDKKFQQKKRNVEYCHTP